ncbi:LLM class flavin-dependent oxidoreductase [Nocardia mangyaensis]|uniref:LLM class flavin-dependent oxidoreductase n=1 Tax=Nocardia mangyaensis TaxID=2213200 RepID=UPI002676791E|nr:LLM class flavin-dependent oxidoreductase [Nocardia mangyaensis]MDO3650689.1 LLM class flavin-dependent oxidoreductase [Nocardia mangyaensis]
MRSCADCRRGSGSKRISSCRTRTSHFRRGAMTDEYLRVITRLWGGGNVSFAGEFVTFGDLLATPTPSRPGGPPIWVGGSAKPALRRAIAHRGTCSPSVTI